MTDRIPSVESRGTPSFVRSTWLLATGQSAVKCSQLILAIVLVRLLGPGDWNQAAFLLSIYLAGTAIGTLNVHHSIIYFLPRIAPGQQQSLVFQNMRLLAGFGGLIVVVLSVAAPWLSGGRLGDADRIPWLALAIAVELPAACISTTLIATARFALASMWDLGGTVIVLACTLGPAAVGAGVPGLIMGLLLTGLLRTTVGSAIVARLLPRSTAPVPTGVMLDQLRYGLPLGLTMAVGILNRLVDKWYIAAFRSGDFGVYAIAAQETPLLAVLPYAGGAVLSAGLVEAFRTRDLCGAHVHWMTLTTSMTFVVVPLGLGLILTAPEIMTFVFTDEFRRGVLPFQLFTLIALHRVAEYGMLLRAAGRTRDILVVAAWTLGTNTVLAAVGAVIGGMVGASLGTVVASGVGWWVALRRIAATFTVPVAAVFPWPIWSAVVVGSTAVAIAAHLVASSFDRVGTRLMVKCLVFALGTVPVVPLARRLAGHVPTARLPDRVSTVPGAS